MAVQNGFTSELCHKIILWPETYNKTLIYIEKSQLLPQLTYIFLSNHFHLCHSYVTLLFCWPKFSFHLYFKLHFLIFFRKYPKHLIGQFTFTYHEWEPPKIASLFYIVHEPTLKMSSTSTWEHTTSFSPPLTYIASSKFTSKSFYL